MFKRKREEGKVKMKWLKYIMPTVLLMSAFLQLTPANACGLTTTEMNELESKGLPVPKCGRKKQQKPRPPAVIDKYKAGHEKQLTGDRETFKTTLLLAEKGNAEAQFNIGEMYFKGEGILQNQIKSLVWLNIAEINGFPNNLRNTVAAGMTLDQIEQAEKRASDCMAKIYNGC